MNLFNIQISQSFSLRPFYQRKDSLLCDHSLAQCMKIQVHSLKFNFIPCIYLFDNDSWYLVFIWNMIQKILQILKYLPFVSVISVIFSGFTIMFWIRTYSFILMDSFFWFWLIFIAIFFIHSFFITISKIFVIFAWMRKFLFEISYFQAFWS